MDFALDDAQQMVREMVRRFAQEQIQPQAQQWMHEAALPASLYATYSELGLKGLSLSEARGGMDPLTQALVIDELAEADASCAYALAAQLIAAQLVEEAQLADIDALLEGESWCALGFGAQGAETMIHVGPQTTHALIIAGATAKLFALEALGLEALGGAAFALRAVSWAKLELSGASPLWSGELTRAQAARISVALAAMLAGVSAGALSFGLTYATERKQFNKRLIDFQVTQFKLADMATLADGAWLMVEHAATCPSDEASDWAAAALHRAQEAALYITDEAVQLHGGYGYTSEYAVERHYRDARMLSTLATAWSAGL